MSLIVHDVSYRHPDRELLFENVGFSLSSGEKAALVGDNGSGKSTLLQVLTGALPAASGSSSVSGSWYMVPQHFGQYDHLTVAGAMGIGEKLAALRAIEGGDASPRHFTLLDDDWTIEQRALEALGAWELDPERLYDPLSRLSGGEKTRVFLAGAAIYQPENLLMDEPSNHLDRRAREQLYRMVRETPATLLVVSHDRRLLELPEITLELHRSGIRRYGGNYSFYREARQVQRRALENALGESEKELRKIRETARRAIERKEKQDARGSGQKKREGVPRIMMNTLRNNAEKSTTRLKQKQTGIEENSRKEVGRLRQELAERSDLRLSLEDSGLHQGKEIFKATGLNYSHTAGEMLWPEGLTFTILSGQRVSLEGNSGAGKTTLVKLLTGELEPAAGSLFRAGAIRILSIDQEYSLIDNRLTVLEQAQRFNRRSLPDHEVKLRLHRYLFPKEQWEKSCALLSGGEKIRLIFCCLTLADQSPDVFVLDEPTNNLDIRSMEIITEALRSYRGTVIVISHDAAIVRDVGVQRVIQLRKR